MKKLLLAFFALPLFSFGQGSQDFSSATLPAAYGDGNFTSGGIVWTYAHSRDQEAFPIDGNGLMLRRASDSYLEWTIPSGVGNITFEYRKAFTGAASRELEVLVNNVQVAVSPSFGAATGEDVTVHTLTHAINESGSATIKIKLTGTATTNRQTTIDNISWTAYAAAGCNISAAGLTALTCNDNGTGNDSADDYLTFSLNPTGSDLGATYSVSVPTGTITPTTGTYGSATSFQLQGGSAGAGNVVVTITDADESGCTTTVTITDPGACSAASPVITATPSSLTGFNHIVGTPSASQSFTVSGLALTNDITVTAPTGFAVSLDNTTFTPSVTLTPTAGTVAATTVHARGNSAVYGAFSGNIIATSTGADNDTVSVAGFANDYIHYTIDQIDGVNASGVADSLNVLVEVSGVVHCMDFRSGSGYNMTIIDGSGKGIYIFSSTDVSAYANPVAGDSITVRGTIAQFNGLLQIASITSIVVEETGAATNAPIVVTTLNESTENQYITLENVTLVTPIATFPTTNTNLDVTNGTSTFQIRILTSTNLGGTPAPQGPFNVTGIGSQFDSSSPYDSGYQLLPCGTDAIEIVCSGANLPNVAVNTTMAGNLSAVATGVTYQWINCAGNTPVAGATNQTFTATVLGQYAVIIDNGTCVDTSACYTSGNVSVDNIELGQSIVAYPNPVNDQLTINNYSNMEVTYTITDINGKVVAERAALNTLVNVNTSSWNKGVYFVNFKGENNSTHTLKVIK